MQKIYITLVLLTVSVCSVLAQQDAQYTQYMYNTQAVNPAYVGSRGVFSAAALYRTQWVGQDGAPSTQTLNVNSPVSKRVGVGVSIVSDEIGNGTYRNTSFDADFSYTIPTSQSGKLSFGLKASGHLLDVNLTNLRNYNPGLLAPEDSGVDKRFSPNFGAGVYYYTNRFYAGVSVPSFLETEHFEVSEETNSYISKEKNTFYLMAGYVTNINANLKLKPAVLVKTVAGAPLQVDVSATFLLNNKLSFGAAYRWDAAVSALVGFQFSDKFLIGIAHDREITEFGGTQFNNGSFEFLLRFELPTTKGTGITSRFF